MRVNANHVALPSHRPFLEFCITHRLISGQMIKKENMFNYSGGKYVTIREKVQASAIIRAFMLRIYVMQDTALLLSRCILKRQTLHPYQLKVVAFGK